MSNEIKSKKSLRERAREFSVQLPFMDGRDKGETKELLGQTITITDYGFLPNEAGEPYVVFITKERSKRFYFGGAVLTDRMSALDADGYREEIVADGMPVRLTEAKSKKTNRTYINVEFFPED